MAGQNQGTYSMSNMNAATDMSASIPPTSCSSTKFRRDRFILSFSGNLSDFYDEESTTLGEGFFGSVKKGTNKATKAVRAIKSMQKARLKDIGRFRQEISIMKKLDHPNVVKLHETYEDHKNVYLVMELCEGGELFDRMISAGNFSEEDAHTIFRQILLAVSHCHCHNIAHRDLKPENFLFLDKSKDSPLKLTDFGLSAYAAADTILSTDAGTPYYVAPEVLGGKYSRVCDIWSAGVMMYILLCGYPPFHGDTDAIILKKVKAGVFDFPENDWAGVSKSAKDLVSRMLTFEVENRITIDEALNHPWIKDQDKRNPSSAKLCDRILENFKVFRALSKLKKMVLTVIARQLKGPQIRDLENIFLSIDGNQDGVIAVHEMKKGFVQAGMEKIPDDLGELMDALDSDGSGHLDYTEFVAAAMEKKQYQQRDICWAAFKTFDVDGNGKISAEELHSVMGNNHVKGVFDNSELEEMKLMIKEIDRDGDGEIDFDEFMSMITENAPVRSKSLLR